MACGCAGDAVQRAIPPVRITGVRVNEQIGQIIRVQDPRVSIRVSLHSNVVNAPARVAFTLPNGARFHEEGGRLPAGNSDLRVRLTVPPHGVTFRVLLLGDSGILQQSEQVQVVF